MRYLFLLLSFLFTTSLSAQLNSGYMGRKLFLQGGTHIGLGSNANFIQNARIFTPQAILMPRLNVDLGYTLSRSLVGRLGWSHLYFDVGSNHTITPTPNSFFTEEHQAVHAVYANDVHLGFDIYSSRHKNHIAPMGTYFTLGIRLVHTHRILTNGTSGVTRYAIMKQKNSYTTFGLDFQYGYRAIIADRFLLSLGISSTLFPTQLFSTTWERESDTLGGESDSNDYKQLLKKALTKRYMVGVYLNFGVFLTR